MPALRCGKLHVLSARNSQRSQATMLTDHLPSRMPVARAVALMVAVHSLIVAKSAATIQLQRVSVLRGPCMCFWASASSCGDTWKKPSESSFENRWATYDQHEANQ